jgi:hypothetical protein
MKDFKKALACVMAVATLSVVTSVVVSADVEFDDVEMSSNTTEYGDVIPYYELPQDFSLRDVLEDENHVLVINGEKFTLTHVDAFDYDYISGNSYNGDYTYFRKGNIVFDGDESILYCFNAAFTKDDGTTWTYHGSAVKEEELSTEDKKLTYEMPISASPTIGDSTEKVEFPETPTGIRGDVNYDGEVNAVDLLLLKKYLLQIITW